MAATGKYRLEAYPLRNAPAMLQVITKPALVILNICMLLACSASRDFGRTRGLWRANLWTVVDDYKACEDDEHALLARVARKDRRAFETLYYRYAPRVGGYLARLLRDPDLVDEAVNDVMMVLWDHPTRFNSAAGGLAGWLLGIAHNKGLKQMERTRRRAGEVSFELRGDQDPGAIPEPIDPNTPEHTVSGWRLGDAIGRALEALSAEQRAAIELCFAEGYSYEEMAQMLGCPIGTVKTRVFHARRRLSGLLAAWDGEVSGAN